MNCVPSFPEETRKNAEKIAKIQSTFEKDPRVKAFGYNDYSTFQWLYNKYVGKPFAPKYMDIAKTDIEKFREGWYEFANTIGKKETNFASFVKLPKAIMRKFPQTATFIEGISNASSFRQRNQKESALHLNKIFDGFYKMVLSGDYHNGVKWSRAEHKYYGKLEQRLQDAVTKDAREKALKDIKEVVGVEDSANNKIGGIILRRFNDIITFKAENLTLLEQGIEREWNSLRKRTAKLALNGIEQAKAVIKTVNDHRTRDDLIAAMEKLQAATERIHFQQSIDAKLVNDRTKLFDINKEDIRVYDADTGLTKPYKMINEAGEREIPRELTKYAPQYVIELANVTRQILDYASNPKDAKWDGKSSAEIKSMIEDKVDLGRMVNRLKARTDIENSGFSSLDPIFYLQKYVQDVTHFNYSTRINLEYKKAADYMYKLTRKEGVARDVGEYARHMGNTLTEIRDSSLNNYEGSLTEMDAAVRWINGMEYISKLGWSVRGGLRNLSQTLFDWVRYGSKGRRIAKNFYIPVEHREMALKQMNRFGYLFETGEKMGATAIATAGSLEQMSPAGTVMTKEGGLKRVKPGVMTKVAEKTAELIETTRATGPLQLAENFNRVKTFKRAFAISFAEMEKNYDYYVREIMDSRGTKTKVPEEKDVRKHIEYLSGNIASKAVGDLHFHYDNWAKAKALQSRRGEQDTGLTGLWGKSKLGPVVGQFQTYRFALWDLQWQMMKDANRARKAGKYGLFETDPAGKAVRIMPEIQQAMRYLSLYSLIVPAISAITNLDLSNLIQNETYDTFNRFYSYYTSDDEGLDEQFFGKGKFLRQDPVVENYRNNADKFIKSNTRKWKEFQALKTAGKKWPYRSPHPIDPAKYDLQIKERLSKQINDYRGIYLEQQGRSARTPEELSRLEDKYGQFFGKGALAGNLGPFVSDILTFADLMDWWDQTPEELQETMKLKYDPDDPDWWYKMARIFSIQGSRTGWHTIPALLNEQWERAARVETGLYKPKYIHKWMLGDDEAFPAKRQNWLDNSPYSPKNWLYKGKILPEVDKRRRKKTKSTNRAIAILDEMLEARR